MEHFDYLIIAWFNQFSHQSWVFDKTIGFIAGNNLVKGGVFISIVWWSWFKNEKINTNQRRNLIATLCASLLAALLSRALALVLPFRLRPMHENDLSIIYPFGADLVSLDGWSSLPSDHAALFFAVSTGLWFVSKKIGLFAYGYTLFFICLPRIYLGYHYPSDLMAGAVIGFLVAIVCNHMLVNSKSVKGLVDWVHAKPEYFYSGFFLVSYQICDMFNGIIAVMGSLSTFAQHFC
jgi:undecaprenyl-diphosphatase